jgi:hypothetical protein
MSKQPTVELFTPDEHRILSAWLKVRPRDDVPRVKIEDALQHIGIRSKAWEPYTRLDAGVAFALLESVESRLPQWGESCNGEVTLARDYRPEALVQDRRILLVPRELFTLNWADSGPGFSWPCAYYVTWVPLYDRYVVTSSADSPEAFGYCDFALGHFALGKDVEQECRRIIIRDWRKRRDRCMQDRWAYLFYPGLINDEQANSWADAVWPEGVQL